MELKRNLSFNHFIVALVPATEAYIAAQGFGARLTIILFSSIQVHLRANHFLQGGDAVIKIIKLKFNIAGHCTIALYQMRVLRETITVRVECIVCN